MNKCHTTLINLYIYIWWVFESLLLWVWWPYPILWQPLGFVIATAIAAGDAACFAASCHSVHPPRKLLYLARQGTKQPSPRWYPSACPDQTPCTTWHDWRPNAVAMAASVSARVAVSWVPRKFPGLQNPALSLVWSLCCVPRESMECIRTNPNTLQEFQDVVAVGTI